MDELSGTTEAHKLRKESLRQSIAATLIADRLEICLMSSSDLCCKVLNQPHQFLRLFLWNKVTAIGDHSGGDVRCNSLDHLRDFDSKALSPSIARIGVLTLLSFKAVVWSMVVKAAR